MMGKYRIEWKQREMSYKEEFSNILRARARYKYLVKLPGVISVEFVRVVQSFEALKQDI